MILLPWCTAAVLAGAGALISNAACSTQAVPALGRQGVKSNVGALLEHLG